MHSGYELTEPGVLLPASLSPLAPPAQQQPPMSAFDAQQAAQGLANSSEVLAAMAAAWQVRQSSGEQVSCLLTLALHLARLRPGFVPPVHLCWSLPVHACCPRRALTHRRASRLLTSLRSTLQPQAFWACPPITPAPLAVPSFTTVAQARWRRCPQKRAHLQPGQWAKALHGRRNSRGICRPSRPRSSPLSAQARQSCAGRWGEAVWIMALVGRAVARPTAQL